MWVKHKRHFFSFYNFYKRQRLFKAKIVTKYCVYNTGTIKTYDEKKLLQSKNRSILL